MFFPTHQRDDGVNDGEESISSTTSAPEAVVDTMNSIAGKWALITGASSFDAGIFGDLADRNFNDPQDDVDAGLNVRIVSLQLLNRGPEQRHATTGDDTLFHRRLCGVHGVFDAVLPLLDLDFG
jgi:hypothetical protein